MIVVPPDAPKLGDWVKYHKHRTHPQPQPKHLAGQHEYATRNARGHPWQNGRSPLVLGRVGSGVSHFREAKQALFPGDNKVLTYGYVEVKLLAPGGMSLILQA